MVRVLCPAKLNLFLSVGPRDTRGYHPIRTVFQAVSLFDELTLESAEEDSFHCEVDLPERNTVTRAWSLLREVVPLPPLRVTLTKRIPMEAGLGGGSTDAAGMIRGVQAMLGLTIPRGELQGLALAIGADVPFFLLGGRAKAEGYGEKLAPMPDPAETWVVVVKPDVGCPTGEMYRRLDEKPYEWMDFGETNEPFNDFERVAPCECLDLIEQLRIAGASAAGMSGSGSAVYGIVPDEAAAVRISHGFDRAFALKFLSREASMAVNCVQA